MRCAVPLPLDEIPVGATFRHPIESDGGVLLVAANCVITPQVISGLRERGFLTIDVDPRDLEAFRGVRKKKAPVKRKATAKSKDWASTKTVKEVLVDRYEEGIDLERAASLKRTVDDAKDQFGEIKSSLADASFNPAGHLQGISEDFARSMVDDCDQTIGIISEGASEFDLDERSVRMSALGMGIAIELELDGAQTLEIGMVALLHDIGLNALGPNFTGSLESLSDSERWEYQKHAQLSVDCVRRVMDLPSSVQIAMLQVHEQFDGSGFPRGLKGKRIHLHARILNVVDAYLQLTSPGPDQAAIVPHDALGLMLYKASLGVFDPKVIRAFLNIETLFPLGSMVELSSGDLARVIRRPRAGFASPVLQGSDGDRVELETADLHVVRPVCNPKFREMRLTKEAMLSSTWHPASHALL